MQKLFGNSVAVVSSILALILMVVVGAAPARAQNYPWKSNGPVTIIVPFGPGGGIDVGARLLAEAVSPALGVPVRVVNRPGSSGMIGTSAALAALNDGHTWLFHSEDILSGYSASGAHNTRRSDWRFYSLMRKGSQRYGIFVRKDVPRAVSRTLDIVWQQTVARSSPLRQWAARSNGQFITLDGDAAEQDVNVAKTKPATPAPAPKPEAKAAPAKPDPAPPPPVAVAPTGPRVALVIGNGKYRFAPVLPNPGNDARDMAAALRDLGFKVIEGYDLDSTGMRSKIAEFGAAMPGAATTLFFYAGHGVAVAGKNYLIPTDAKLARPSALNIEALEVDTILADMETEKRTNLVFLDACRDNPLARSLARSFGGTRSSAVGQGLAQVNAGIGTLITFATSPNTVALDGSGRNSPFTTALLRHIRTPNVEVRTLLTRVRADVIRATNEKQIPWDHSSLTGEFYFKRGG